LVEFIVGTRQHIVMKRMAIESGRRIAGLLFALTCMLGGGVALAGEAGQPGNASDRYQVFFGAPQPIEHSDQRWRFGEDEWPPLSSRPAGYDAGMTFFTPRVTGVDLGIGLSSKMADSAGTNNDAQIPAGGRNWRLGGSVGTSTIRLGAAFGDHSDPACRESAACGTNDFWDIGLSWRFGSGALAAGYTASLRRLAGAENLETLDIFSVTAGYRIAPGVDVFGGIDWIELPDTQASEDQPRNTRFMLGTSLRF
jgi:hypothetical protein